MRVEGFCIEGGIFRSLNVLSHFLFQFFFLFLIIFFECFDWRLKDNEIIIVDLLS